MGFRKTVIEFCSFDETIQGFLKFIDLKKSISSI